MKMTARVVRMPDDLIQWIGEKAKEDERSWNQMTIRILDAARKKDLARQAKEQSRKEEPVNV